MAFKPEETIGQLHPDCVLPPYRSAVTTRRLLSRCRRGCHALDVDTCIFLPVGQQVPREQRFCLVCASDTAEDEHHFQFDRPAHHLIRNNFSAFFWGPAHSLSFFFALHGD